MIIDTLTTFAYNTSVALNVGGPTTFGDQIDLEGLGLEEGATGEQRDIGIHGHTLYYRVMVGDEAFESASATSNVTFTLVTADNAALTTNPVVVDTFTVAVDNAGANFPVGTKLREVVLPSFAYKRYIGLRRTVATQNLAEGSVSAFLQLDPKGWRSYPQADIAD